MRSLWLDRVWRSANLKNDELTKAIEDTEKIAVAAGNVDDEDAGLPIVIPDIWAGDFFIPPEKSI